ncbi:cytochrome-c peroxidase [Lacibacter sediminis]|uniref:Cytochrome-c peroxidase n=1 Tax=Lacibacter sediminis TaxID=2760713 RepID=A0A7G5XMA7_9BACT|nr:cytochrome c peroxidase [Lacibacter sediminis]QNA46610.1 cytochrome-c peroxidase [Lacibacter sediminis]
MYLKAKVISLLVVSIFFFTECSKKETIASVTYEAIKTAFANRIDPANLANYANQTKPAYITKDNSGANAISNSKATVGRVLFYDNNLSIDNSLNCGSCHKQSFAFSDTALASKGVAGGLTGRHSMRLINSRFAVETKFFWDERALTLEAQTSQPIKDHAEMGFSGQNGRPAFSNLLSKLQAIGYYKELFTIAYGNETITEARIQECLAQFIRSIQSFDSKYDAGRALVNNDNQPFPNFTAQENDGKALFLTPPVFDATGNRIAGGLGCQGCHAAPEFDIAPNSGNNGIIGVLNGAGIDINNTRAPSLRDLVNRNGEPNGPMMHTGGITTLQAVIGHYGTINLAPGNNRLDPKLRPNGFGQQLHLTAAEVNATMAFLRTLTGTNVYTDAKWSSPF